MSGNNEREKRAFDEPEKLKEQEEQEGIGTLTANKIVSENFKYGDFIYIYYKYLDKFHVEPKGFVDLFEYMNYNDTIIQVENALDSLRKIQNGK